MSDYKRYDEDRSYANREPVEQPAERGARTAFQPKMGTIANAPFVKVRKSPKPDAISVTYKRKGDRVNLLGRDGNYYKIVANGKSEGYILSDYIQED